MSYQLGDFIIRLKNACMARRRTVVFPYSKINIAIGQLLTKEGFLESIIEEEIENRKVLVGQIKYNRRKPVLVDVSIISKPSLRVYAKAKGGAKRRSGMVAGLEILSTNQGILSAKEAKKRGVGGESLFRVW